MVKITLSFVAIAALVASVAAYPFQDLLTPRIHELLNECVPGVSVKEYHPFRLVSPPYKATFSRRVGTDLLRLAYSTEPNYEFLEFCVVSTDLDCKPAMPSNCIYDNVEYRFRVHSPIQGYLKVVNGEVVIVDSFNEASGLNFLNTGDGLKISYMDRGELFVFKANNNRKITIALPDKSSTVQQFAIQPTSALREPTCNEQ